jgi:signal peptidase I
VSFDLSEKSDYGPVMVPAGHYFMMGDNRDNSEDSRYWGFMPADYIKGKALFVYFSFADPEERESGSFAGVRWSRLLHQIH